MAPSNWRIVVIVDRDSADCLALKQRLEDDAAAAGLVTRTRAGDSKWQVVNRIAVEELEAWYFGEWASVHQAFPKVDRATVAKAAYRDCDAIDGGTWEALERVLQRRGYFADGLRKVEAARMIGKHFEPGVCVSPSFVKFHGAIVEALEG